MVKETAMNIQPELITFSNLTKDYGNNRGVFDFNFAVKKGEVFGLVGENGAGKSTTMRLLMGFIHPSSGKASIYNKDVWQEAAVLKRKVAYVPGEIDFPDTPTGTSFLKMQMSLLKNINKERINTLIQIFKIDITADLKRMSKGMKQKMALVYAFMTKAPILLLDEPTTGLDPVMRDVFIKLILECKQNGTTILMSSHMFNELEPTCDRIGFLKEGKLVDIIDQEKIRQIHSYQKVYVKLATQNDFKIAQGFPFSPSIKSKKNYKLVFTISQSEVSQFIRHISKINVNDISFEAQSLDDYFKQEL